MNGDRDVQNKIMTFESSAQCKLKFCYFKSVLFCPVLLLWITHSLAPSTVVRFFVFIEKERILFDLYPHGQSLSK